jgi:hypothetical protein
MALPVIRFETDPMGSLTSCYQFVVRIAPVGRGTAPLETQTAPCGAVWWR